MGDGLFHLDALDMGAVVAELEEAGAVSLPMLDDGFRRRLLDEARRATYRRARKEVGGPDRIVRQDMDVCDSFAADGAFNTEER